MSRRNEPLFDEQICRVCGCTWDYGCPGGCYWVEEDLCSSCADKIYLKKKTEAIEQSIICNSCAWRNVENCGACLAERERSN